MGEIVLCPTVIAEAGVNHNGKLDLAIDLIDCALEAKADVVKFQLFDPKKLVNNFAPKANYQIDATGAKETQLQMLSKLALTQQEFRAISRHCEESGLVFLATAFDEASLDFLIDELGQKMIKVPSGDLTNGPLLLIHARKGLKMLVSTGMATLGEIEAALGVIAFGLLEASARPSIEAFQESFRSDEGQAVLRHKVTLLHCTTEYPTPPNEVNISAMSTLASAFKLDIGFSDHSEGNVASCVAVALGAKVLEKHFTIDKQMDGPDHKASLSPGELSEYVEAINETSLVMGHGRKIVTDSESKNKIAARRSLVAARDILRGEVLDADAISIQRPGGGIAPMNYWEMLGAHSKRNYKVGDLL